MNEEQTRKTGTTTVGLIGKDFIVLGADNRATAGNLIVSRNAKKIKTINDTMAITTSGSVSDTQLTKKILTAELKIREIRNDRVSTVKEAANLLANMTYGNIRRYVPGFTHFLLGGVDAKGPSLYEVFLDGSLLNVADEQGFIATGSGTPYALALMEDNYKEDLNEEEMTKLAERAVRASLKRDSASGNGIDILVIRKEDAKFLPRIKIE